MSALREITGELLRLSAHMRAGGLLPKQAVIATITVRRPAFWSLAQEAFACATNPQSGELPHDEELFISVHNGFMVRIVPDDYYPV